jgi:hypothetical protein
MAQLFHLMASLRVYYGTKHHVETSKMNNLYALSIRYFLLMLLMLISTGIWMLILHTTLEFESFSKYYVEKSSYGLLEVVTPHLFGMGIIIFILTHFLSLKKKNSKLEDKATLLLFSMSIILNISVFFITETTPWLAWLKLFSTLAFLGLSFFVMFRVWGRTYVK